MDVRKRSALSFLAAAAALVLLLAPDAEAYPKTRTVKDHRRGTFGNLLLQQSNSVPECPHTVPCGWALYHQRQSSALRPIYEYTRNTFCSCAADRECVYQENRSDMRAYVFYCRNVNAESGRDVYTFPDTT